MREELITSAVQFLTDPAVQQSPIAKRIAFLESKGMNAEEIDEAIKRSNGANSVSSGSTNTPSAQYMINQPPPLPDRDWRDWFIMAVVSGGVGYGLYYLARNYIMPLIAPPPPPQIITDKKELEDQYAQLSSILDQLSLESTELKKNQQEQQEKITSALADVSSIVDSLKGQVDQRESDVRGFKSDIESIRDLIPKALDKNRENQTAALVDLQTELKSLKSLLSSRQKVGAGGVNVLGGTTNGVPSLVNGGQASVGATPADTPPLNATSGVGVGGGGGKPSIPSWQLTSTPAQTQTPPPSQPLSQSPSQVQP